MFTAVMSFGMLCLVATSGLMYVEAMEELFNRSDAETERDPS